ncbi:hypothetical protein V7S43_001417 [Phytophthora oleae]|uniref:Calponin-homology (CH) domain-containing protein n=1 Tax=Phytophthora oleae TaxID=2107226 RepID=A0ABD3G6V3_9STRA
MSLRKLKWRGIGRLELLAWVNEFLQTDYTKLEHLADGIAYCQIFDALYPGKVNLHQLNFQARSEMEYERNFKLLRRTFHLCDVKKEIRIRKLVQGIFQEHFEFLHWVHDYVHRTCPDAVRSYHGFERRQDALRLSFSDSQVSNSNLIPKYSNSMKIPREAYIEGYEPEGDRDGNIEISSVGECSSNGVQEEPNADVSPDDDERLEALDPVMEVVRTLAAKSAVTKLEECMKSVGVMPSQSKVTAKKESFRRSNAPSEAKSRTKKTKARTEVVIEDPAEPDPMMCRYMAELLECLESELLGRVKDLQCLENSIEVLTAIQPS